MKRMVAVMGAAELLAAAGAAGQVASFEPLGVFGEASSMTQPSSYAAAVSADGAVVCGHSYVFDAFHATTMPVAICWRDGAWGQVPGTGHSFGHAVSHSGAVVTGVGQIQIPGGWFSPFLARLGVPTAYPPIELGSPFGLSGDGLTVVGNSMYDGAFAWTEARGVVDLGHIPGWGNDTRTAATDASADGGVIVGRDHAGNDPQAFLWTQASGMVGLGFLDPAGRHSRANAVSEDGLTVVGASRNSAGQIQGFTWSQARGMRPLPLLNGTAGGEAHDTSADGSVIVGEAGLTQAPWSIAYSWDRVRGRRDLKQHLIWMGATGLSGWTLTRATAISPDGAVIVGEGIDPQGRNQAWRARIPAFCYANCDGSSASPALNVNDFVCFQTRFAAGDIYANCDDSTVPPVLNVADFVCFMNGFAAGCP